MKPTYLLLLSILFFSSCKKDNYTNFNATISTDSQFITTYEGSPLIFNLNFDKKLSEPIQIIGEIYNDHSNFINQEDYHNFLEYSTDLGKTWHKGSEDYKITVPKKTGYLKLRIATLDDSDIEVNELFDLELSKAPGQNKLDVLNAPLHFEMKVIDNEKISRTLENSSQIIVFDMNGESFTPIAATDELEFSALKFLFDEKKYTEFIEKSVALVNSYFDDAHDVKRFELFANTSVYGYVYNRGSGTSNDWAMGLNAISAYLEVNFDDETGAFTGVTRQPYNFDGEASYTLVHEAGHILSLTNGIHINNTLPVEDCGFTDNYGDCFLKDSWMTTFYNRFYNAETKEPVVLPEFVTDYASYNLGEDVAETITIYTILESEGRLPKLDENSSTAVKKLHFIGQQAEVPPYAKALFKSNPKANETIYQKSNPSTSRYLFDAPLKNRHKGTMVSCREVPELLKKEK